MSDTPTFAALRNVQDERGFVPARGKFMGTVGADNEALQSESDTWAAIKARGGLSYLEALAWITERKYGADGWGVIPGQFGLVCVDLDAGNTDEHSEHPISVLEMTGNIVDRFGKPHIIERTKSGGMHLWYQYDNSKSYKSVSNGSKMADLLTAGTVPLYWGEHQVGEWRVNGFTRIHDFLHFEASGLPNSSVLYNDLLYMFRNDLKNNKDSLAARCDISGDEFTNGNRYPAINRNFLLAGQCENKEYAAITYSLARFSYKRESNARWNEKRAIIKDLRNSAYLDGGRKNETQLSPNCFLNRFRRGDDEDTDIGTEQLTTPAALGGVTIKSISDESLADIIADSIKDDYRYAEFLGSWVTYSLGGWDIVEFDNEIRDIVRTLITAKLRKVAKSEKQLNDVLMPRYYTRRTTTNVVNNLKERLMLKRSQCNQEYTKVLLGHGRWYDVATGKLGDAVREDYFIKRVPTVPHKGETPLFDRMLKHLGDEYGEDAQTHIDTLMKWVGSTFFRVNLDKLSWNYWGEGDGGKSQFFLVALGIMGWTEDNPTKGQGVFITSDRFKKRSSHHRQHFGLMESKTLIIMEDISDAMLETADLKKIVTGEGIEYNRMYEGSRFLKPEGKLATVSNHQVTYAEGDSGDERRKIISRISTKVPDELYVEDFENQIKYEYPAILHKFLTSARAWYKEGGIKRNMPTLYDTEREESLMASDIVYAFLIEHTLFGKEVYENYPNEQPVFLNKLWRAFEDRENSLNPKAVHINIRSFGKRIRRYTKKLGYEEVQERDGRGARFRGLMLMLHPDGENPMKAMQQAMIKNKRSNEFANATSTVQ